ncbi:MAG: 2-hydroxychromene-2-carboxylate isomerase [Pseudomonadota bacterium]|nr:2-hydroxychromene-2-carboxylate isomerase [Pseudomonadota bacterium]
MAKTLEFLFDFASPNCWLAYRALPPMLARTGARLEIEPVLLGGLFKATGNQSPMTAFAQVKGKLAYEDLEMRRFIARHGLTQFRMNPHFPVNTLLLMRGFVAARRGGQGAAYLEAGLRGLWEEGLALADPAVLQARLDRAGLDGAALVAAAQTPEVTAALAEATERAVARGAFGLPTFFIGEEMYFGKERLGQIEQDLAAP